MCCRPTSPAGSGSKALRASCSLRYGYQEIRVPIVEHTALFKRSIGEFTDIVQKEMFTFEDPGGDSLTLRPEATAGIVRAMISNGLLHNQRQRVWCAGPMFRYERPQARSLPPVLSARCRGVRLPGSRHRRGADHAQRAPADAALGVQRIELHLNSLGTPASRRVYREKLVEYFTAHKSQLDADSLRRLEGNPLRILDSKNPELQDVIAGAPMLTEYLDEESRQHFYGLCRHLDAVGIQLRAQSAPGARARLLYAHGFRVADDRAGLARRGLLGRPLRRPGRRSWAASPRRPSAGRSARNASCRCCGHRTARRRRYAPDVYFVIAGERAPKPKAWRSPNGSATQCRRCVSRAIAAAAASNRN